MFVAYVGQELLDLGIPARCRVITTNPSADLDNARSNNCRTLTEWRTNSELTFYHGVVEFEYEGRRYFLDSENLDTPAEFPFAKWIRSIRPLHPEPLTIEEVSGMAEVSDGWNEWFDRSQMPELKEGIKNLFAEMRAA